VKDSSPSLQSTDLSKPCEPYALYGHTDEDYAGELIFIKMAEQRRGFTQEGRADRLVDSQDRRRLM
jgi:hypothetical protein